MVGFVAPCSLSLPLQSSPSPRVPGPFYSFVLCLSALMDLARRVPQSISHATQHSHKPSLHFGCFPSTVLGDLVRNTLKRSMRGLTFPAALSRPPFNTFDLFILWWLALQVSVARPSSKDIKNSKLYVTNLPDHFSQDQVVEVFEQVCVSGLFLSVLMDIIVVCRHDTIP